MSWKWVIRNAFGIYYSPTTELTLRCYNIPCSDHACTPCCLMLYIIHVWNIHSSFIICNIHFLYILICYGVGFSLYFSSICFIYPMCNLFIILIMFMNAPCIIICLFVCYLKCIKYLLFMLATHATAI